MAYKEQGSSGQRTFMGTVRGGYSICGDEDAVEDAGIQGSWVWLCGSALQERRADGLRMDRFWWDDWSLLPLYALSVAMVPVVHYVVYYGFGQDIWELRAAEVRKYLIVSTLVRRPHDSFILTHTRTSSGSTSPSQST